MRAFAQSLLSQVAPGRRFVIAIDGFGGSGKSTLAARLAKYLPGIATVSVDDFLEPLHDGILDFHWDRFTRDVIAPLRNNAPLRYRRYDRKLGDYQGEVAIEQERHVIVEGVYVTQDAFRDAYQVTVWVDTAEHVRLARGVARDGEETRPMWENVWLPYTRKYLEEHRPHAKVDHVIDGEASSFFNDEIVFIVRA